MTKGRKGIGVMKGQKGIRTERKKGGGGGGGQRTKVGNERGKGERD